MICINSICISFFQLFLIIFSISIIIYMYLKIHDTINSNNKLLINKIDENEKKLLTNTRLYNKNNQDNTSHNGLPINITTQPIPPIQQIGSVYKHDIADSSLKPGDSDLSVVLPLFGRQLHTGSTKWIYYTNNNSVRIPIFYNNIQCDKELGCSELYTDDTVSIPSLNGNFKIHIDEKENLQYIPY